jgi:hypothetical protein
MDIEKIIKRNCKNLTEAGPLGDHDRAYETALRLANTNFGHMTDEGLVRIELDFARKRFRMNLSRHQDIADCVVLNTILDEIIEKNQIRKHK